MSEDFIALRQDFESTWNEITAGYTYGFSLLPIKSEYVKVIENLAFHHRDSFGLVWHLSLYKKALNFRDKDQRAD